MRKIEKRWTWRLLAAAMLALGVCASAQAASGDQKIRVVSCDEPVQSQKRGVCANHLNAEDFRALAPGVSWWYTWHFAPTDTPPAGVSMNFLPMAWGDRPADTAGLEAYLAAGHKPSHVLAINEPNLKGQAFIPPEQAAKFYLKVKAIADKYGIPTVGPHMALGSAANESIKAMDPIDKKEVTYTFMIPYLKAFMSFIGNDADVSATSLHSYGSIEEMRWAVDLMHKTFNKPVWVTEYAQWKAPNEAASVKYLIQSSDFLERNPDVAGYAWFKERVDRNGKISLFEKEAGKLTPMGAAYVALPVHDADLYYRIPGNLSAGKYVAIDKMEIEPGAERDALVDMFSKDRGATIDYNIDTQQAGKYAITIRTGGEGKIELLQGEKTAATAESTSKDWQDVKTTMELPAGPQTLQIRLSAKDQKLESLVFEKGK